MSYCEFSLCVLSLKLLFKLYKINIVHSGSQKLFDYSKTDLSVPSSSPFERFTALRVVFFTFLFVVTAAGVVPCAVLKGSPVHRT